MLLAIHQTLLKPLKRILKLKKKETYEKVSIIQYLQASGYKYSPTSQAYVAFMTAVCQVQRPSFGNL